MGLFGNAYQCGFGLRRSIIISVKDKPCAVTTIVSENEKRLFVAVANSLDIPYSSLLRRLIRYFLDGKILWDDLFRQYDDVSRVDELDDSCKRTMRTHLAPELNTAFLELAENWGSTGSVVLRRLILLYTAGKIKRGDIW